MKLTRRNFIKSILGLTAITALGLPEISDEIPITEARQFFKQLPNIAGADIISGEWVSLGNDNMIYPLSGGNTNFIGIAFPDSK